MKASDIFHKISCQSNLSHSMFLPFVVFFARKCQTLHLGLLSCILLFLTQHSNLSGSLWVLILSPLVLTLPPRFVTSTPLISMPPEFSSSDKSDMIKDGALRTQQKHSLKVDTHCHELETAPLRSEEMEHREGSLHTHPWDCLTLPLPPQLLLPSCSSLLKPASLSASTALGLPDDPLHVCPLPVST